MTISKAEVIISAQDRASEVLRRLGSTVDRAQSSFERINAPLLRFQTLWASLVGGAIVAGFRSLVSAIDDLDEAAQGLGTTAVELSNLRIAAGEAGIGTESFDTALTRLNVNISEAAAGSKQQAALFKALGISIKDAAGNVRPTHRSDARAGRPLAQLERLPAKAALAVDRLAGRAAAAAAVDQGAAGLDKFSGLTEETVRSAAKLQGELDKLNVEWERMKFAVAGGVVPAINDVIDVIRQVDFSKVGAEFNTFFLGELWRGDQGIRPAGRGHRRPPEAAARSSQVGRGAYSNEGRAALQSAQAIRDKAEADAEATTATKRKAKATRNRATPTRKSLLTSSASAATASARAPRSRARKRRRSPAASSASRTLPGKAASSSRPTTSRRLRMPFRRPDLGRRVRRRPSEGVRHEQRRREGHGAPGRSRRPARPADGLVAGRTHHRRRQGRRRVEGAWAGCAQAHHADADPQAAGR